MPRASMLTRHHLFPCAVAVSMLAAAACDPPRRPQDVTEVPVAVTAPPTGLVSQAGGLSPVAAPTPNIVPKLATYDNAEAAYRSGNYAEAKTLFAGVVSVRPADGFSHYMLGLASWKSGDLSGAVKAFDGAIALDPTHLKAYLNSARVLLDLKRDQEALERAEKAVALEPEAVEAVRVLARAHAALGHVDAALEGYRQALVLDDEDLWALNNLGMLFVELGDPDAALGPLARAVQLKSTAPVFQNNLGIALELDGYPLAAKEAYQAALRADSTYKKAAANLDRIIKVTPEGTVEEPVVLSKVADLFRLEVAMWRDSRTIPVTAVDTLPPQ